MTTTIYTRVEELEEPIRRLRAKIEAVANRRFTGLCGFDGFIDTLIQVQQPSTMKEFGGKVSAAAGIAASYPVRHVGERFGGNGPLLASALHGVFQKQVGLTYIGALGRPNVLPMFREALGHRTQAIYSLAEPAHSDCLEFRDGKVMLSDLSTCAEIDWSRLLEVVPLSTIDDLLRTGDFVAAVNWGKLVNVGSIWENLVIRMKHLGVPAKQKVFFMDLAEFEQRSAADIAQLPALFESITAHCTSVLSLNLKEAWQLADLRGGGFHGRKSAVDVAALTSYLRQNFAIDRVVVHPNDGAACASQAGCVYIPGPFCREPLISIGAGDHFGGGSLAAQLCGFDDLELLLMGCCCSGFFVRSGRAPTISEIGDFASRWTGGQLPERL
jgi:hypothetical protein